MQTGMPMTVSGGQVRGNINSIKELNEFEVANFGYEADHIRVFVQTNDYVRTFSNQPLNQMAGNKSSSAGHQHPLAAKTVLRQRRQSDLVAIAHKPLTARSARRGLTPAHPAARG